jgi:hypothetical protein
MLREFLRFTEEAQYGVFNSAAVAGTNQFVMRLDDSNAFSVRKATVPVRIMWGGGWAVPGYTFSDKMTVQGAYRCKLYYSQAGWLLPWGLTGMDATQMIPWASSEPVGDLPSMSIDHAYFYDDTPNTFKRTRYLGCKVTSGRLETSAESQFATLTLQITGGTAQGEHFTPTSDPTAADFPPPVDTDYPSWDVVTFTDSCGNFQLGTVLTKYESLAFDWTNKIDARFFCAHFVQEARCLGRDLNLEAQIKVDQTPDLRDQYERVQALATKLMFTNGLKTILLDFKGQGILTKLDEDLQIDKIYMRSSTFSSQYDPAAGTDFSVSVT